MQYSARALLAIAAATALLVPASSRGALARPVSVEALARDADAVVRAHVERREARWAADGRHIETFVTLRVSSTWRGQASQSLAVRVPGGEVGEFGQRVDASPQFEDGEEVVVFLKRGPGAEWRVHGLGLGKYRIAGGEAHPSLESFTFVAGGVARGERHVGRMPLNELERRVRSIR